MSFMPAKLTASLDPYGPIHKGLLLAQTQMLVRLGACGGDDPDELAELLGDICTLLHVSEEHMANEERWLHAALAARSHGSTTRLTQGHDQARRSSEALEALIGRIETADLPAREPLIRQLYLRFSVFIAEDFAHMAEEEQVMAPVLRSLFTDEELATVQDRILSSLDPDEVVTFGRLMIPAATRADRIALLQAMRANAPPAAFEAILQLSARPTLSAGDFSHLCDGLGIAA